MAGSRRATPPVARPAASRSRISPWGAWRTTMLAVPSRIRSPTARSAFRRTSCRMFSVSFPVPERAFSRMKTPLEPLRSSISRWSPRRRTACWRETEGSSSANRAPFTATDGHLAGRGKVEGPDLLPQENRQLERHDRRV